MSLLFVSRLSRYYKVSSDRFYALKGVSLAFPEKGFVAIKGKSGSGKSTLLNLLAGIDTPSEGKVIFCGEAQSKENLGDQTALIFQHYNLIGGLSVFDNVMLPARIHQKGGKQVKELLKRFGLDKHSRKDVAKLSGGEKQRVAICRALISEPRVVFADEPTGALDEKNSELVMGSLKEISKKKLVIMVSHNDELIERFADRVIEIRDGKVVADNEPIKANRVKAPPHKKRHGRNWILPFIGKNLKSHALKDSMCLLAGVVGFSSLLLSVGFFVGNAPAIEKEQVRTLHYLSATICQESETEIPGTALKLIKKTRPSIEETVSFLAKTNDCKIVNDYSYFFPPTMVYEMDGQMQEPVTFSPIWDLTLQEYGVDLLYKGEASPDNSFDYCLANTEFMERYGWEMLGKTIKASSRFVLTYEEKKNERFVDASFRLVGAVKEFGFLNSPRLYYSYQGLEAELSRIDIDGETSSSNVKEMVDMADPDSSIASYQWQVYLRDASQTKELFALIDQDQGSIKADSTAYGLRASFLALSEAFVSSLSLFVGIAFAGVALILAMAGFSSLVAGRKENAIILSQGGRRSDVLLLYSVESMLLCALSAVISLIISPLFQQIGNLFLKQEFDVSGIISIPYASFIGVPFLLVWGLLLAGMAYGFLSSFVPISFSKHGNLSEELRDE